MLNRILLLVSLLSFQAFAAEPVILLTGFEPFGGAKLNASWEAVRKFQDQIIAGHRVETLELPVVYDAVDTPLRAAIEKFKPAAVYCFGEGTPTIQIETLARNGYHPTKPKDNKGQRPPREKIVNDGKDSIKTGLPALEIANALNSSQIPARLSQDAGGYLCNECFYRVMALEPAPALRGFIHVPVLDTKDDKGVPFDIERIKEAVKIAIEVGIAKKPR